jgi:hypothetical protein
VSVATDRARPYVAPGAVTHFDVAVVPPSRDDCRMAWHRLLAPLALPCSLVLACIGGQVQDSGDFDGGGSTTTEGTNGTTSATSTGSGSTVTTTDSGSSTAATSTTTATEGSTAADSTAADSTTGEPGACTEALTCNPGEICVLPCCGGPAPGCFELPPGGECGPDGTPDEGGVRCCQNAGDPKACMQMQWCSPVPCMADPPYCATADQLDCNGNDCSAPSCFNGQLQGDQLQCSCK